MPVLRYVCIHINCAGFCVNVRPRHWATNELVFFVCSVLFPSSVHGWNVRGQASSPWMGPGLCLFLECHPHSWHLRFSKNEAAGKVLVKPHHRLEGAASLGVKTKEWECLVSRLLQDPGVLLGSLPPGV